MDELGRGRTSAVAAKRSFSQYSIALTSWLVRDSISFTRSAVGLGKSAAACRSSPTRRRRKRPDLGHGRLGGSAISHSISTRTR